MNASGRLIELEQETEALRRRVASLEATVGGVEPHDVAAASWQQSRPELPLAEDAPAAVAEPSPLRAALAGGSWEDLVGGRVLAWVGGLAIAVGVALLFALAISQGWIDPAARVLLAGSGSLALLGAGVWLHEHRGRTDAARAAAASAIASLFATVTVAARVYDLIPAYTGLALVLLVGALAVPIAIRWNSRGIAALGILGGLLAPAMVVAPSDLATMGLLIAASGSAAAVLLWRRWEWLALGAFAVTAPQWMSWLFHASAAEAVVVLTLFGILNATMAVGFDIRRGGGELRIVAVFLLALNAIAIGLAGWLSLKGLGHESLAKGWVVAVGMAHIAGGVAGTRTSRASRDLVLVALGLGTILCDFAFGLLAGGVALPLGWAATGVGFALLARRARTDRDAIVALAGVGGHLALALVRALGAALQEGGADGAVPALIGLAALAAGCFASARIADARWASWRVALDAVGLAAVAYLSAVAVDGAALGVAWAIEAGALAQIAARGDDRVAAIGAACFLGGALLEALSVTPPSVLIYGLHEPVPQAGAVVAVALISARFAVLRLGGGRWPVVAVLGACAAVLYLASGALMTAFQPDAATSATTILAVGVRQEGQMLMSALWTLSGVIALVVGLRNDARPIRFAALGLILAATGKVFLFDLAALSSLYRVASFLALGLLLLIGAFVWQRARPGELRDLRTVA